MVSYRWIRKDPPFTNCFSILAGFVPFLFSVIPCYTYVPLLAEIAPSGHFLSLRLPRDRTPSSRGIGAPIRSSPDGQDKAKDTIIVVLRLIGGLPGGGDGSYVLLAAVGADAGAGRHLGQGAPVRSSPDGQDEAIDTPTTLLPGLEVQK